MKNNLSSHDIMKFLNLRFFACAFLSALLLAFNPQRHDQRERRVACESAVRHWCRADCGRQHAVRAL